MKGMHILEECLELEFTLLRTPQKATNMCMEQGEELAVPHTKTGRVTSATGRTPAEFPTHNSDCPGFYDPGAG